MEDIPLDRAKHVLEDLVDRARHGEDVRILTADGAVVQLRPISADPTSARTAKRRPGRLKGVLQTPDDLMAPLPDEELRHWIGDQT